MAGRPQKPFHMLQDQRRSRRRPTLVLYAPDQLPPAQAERRSRALDVAAGEIERQFGQGAITERAGGARTPAAPPSAKSRVAAGKPRDPEGRFIKRGSPVQTGEPDAPTKQAKRPNLIEVADELGDAELADVIAALVRLRERRRGDTACNALH